MNSFERFDAILSGKKPDRMPIYHVTISCGVASEILGYPAHTGGESLHYKEPMALIRGEEAYKTFVDKYYNDAYALYKRLKADVVRDTWRNKWTPDEIIDTYTFAVHIGEGRRIYKYFPDTESFGILKMENIAPDPDEYISGLYNQIEKMPDDRAIAGLELSDTFDTNMKIIYADTLRMRDIAAAEMPCTAAIGGFGSMPYDIPYMMATVLCPEALAEYYYKKAKTMLPDIRWLARQGFKLITTGCDLAGPNGPFISPQYFEQALAPAYKLLSDECKNQNVVLSHGSDGQYWEIADILVRDCGFRALNEVDDAAGMTTAALRKRYPELLIVGCINSSTLHKKSEYEVRKETRRSLEGSEGIYYIPGVSNAIMPGTPVTNVYAMIDEIEKYKP